MRIYKVVFTKTDQSQPAPYYGRRTTYHELRHAESQAKSWRSRGWDAKVIQSTEFDWEE
jgi:hypothetical protein